MTRAKRSTRRIQRAVRGQRRRPIAASALVQVERIVRATAERFNVSRSFVINVALCAYFKVPMRERYDDGR